LPKLPVLSAAEIVRALERLGFAQVRQRGSHIILKKRVFEGSVGCIVPAHKVVAAGTLRGILRQAKVEPDDFLKML
jgi:predicted RNA binding protein YcfA (HicA-like mRNA interferase family)